LGTVGVGNCYVGVGGWDPAYESLSEMLELFAFACELLTIKYCFFNILT